MKRFISVFSFLIGVTFLLTTCTKEPQSSPPISEGLPTEIITSPGNEINIKGTFTTDGQFSKISLKNSEILLNKEIVFANVVSKYYLDYKFYIEESTNFCSYTVEIIAENTDGVIQSFETELIVASTPEISGLVSNISASPGETVNIKATVTDGQGIAHIIIQNQGVGLDEQIDLSGSELVYELDINFEIPSSIEVAVHKGQISVINVSGISTISNLNFNLTGEEVTYTSLYAAGGVQWWTWNAERGYMMIPNNSDNAWFETVLPAWPEEGYNEVKVLGQLAWAPDNWGLLDNSDPNSAIVNSEDTNVVKMYLIPPPCFKWLLRGIFLISVIMCISFIIGWKNRDINFLL